MRMTCTKYREIRVQLAETYRLYIAREVTGDIVGWGVCLSGILHRVTSQYFSRTEDWEIRVQFAETYRLYITREVTGDIVGWGVCM